MAARVQLYSTIEYNANGGNNAPSNTVDVTLADVGSGMNYVYVRTSYGVPTRSGYSFVNWKYTQYGVDYYAVGGTEVTFQYSVGGGIQYDQYKTVTMYAQWQILVTEPTITTQPSSKSVYRGDSTSVYISATTAYGTLSYQWQSSVNGSTWSNISGATSNTYSPSTSTVGVTYFRCVVTSTAGGQSKTSTSASASVTVNATPIANITQQPQDATVFVGSTATVSVSATGNSLAYQWEQSADGTNFTAVSGATSNSYTYPTSSVGEKYYRCYITNTLNGYTASTYSNAAKITVQSVSAPVFTQHPQGQVVYIGITANPLTAIVTSNGTITYQWYSSSDNSSWNAITGATNTSYTPPSSTVGLMYYRVTATATGGSQTQTASSNSAAVNVVQASVPVFNFDLSTIDVTYNANEVASALDGSATAPYGTITYQWYKSYDNGSTWIQISGATNDRYTPTTAFNIVELYKVVATNIVGTSSQTATSNNAKVTVVNAVLSPSEKWAQYLNVIKSSFIKLARLDFLQPNGSVSYSLDNNPLNKRSGAFIQSGTLTVNLQNGQRRSATVTLSNLDGEYDYSVNKLWFGQQVQLWMGVKLPSGEDFYISQGVFYVKDPEESFKPGLRQTTLYLVDKWAYLDGTLFGNLDGTYEVPVNSNIFNVIASVLLFPRGNGQVVDSSAPIFTSFYNGKTTTLPDGSTVPLTNTPYTYRCDSENGTYADIILEMNTMLAGWIGYDSCGQLRLSPSQDDILDQTKPIQWEFTPKNSTFLGATYSIKNSEVYNDIIIIGESLSEYGQTAGRATNYDPRSDTNANIIGLKTKRYSQSGYYTQDICESMAVFKLKRQSVLKKSVTIESTQMFHLQENNLVTIQRTDKPGNPVERHLITGYSIPIAQDGPMSISATAVNDFPVATVTQAP